MSATPKVDLALRRGLDALRHALDLEREGAPAPADEAAWFRLVDEVAAQDAHDDLLEEIGERFADAFVDPYLHASDLTGVLREVGGLLSIHHRARLAVEHATHREAVVLLSTIASDGDAKSPTPFEVAVVRRAVQGRFPGTQIAHEACTDVPRCERLRVRLPAR